jgi:hypothetical protein
MVRPPHEAGGDRKIDSKKPSKSRKVLMSSSIGSGITEKSFFGIFAASIRTTDKKRPSEFFAKFPEISSIFDNENCKHKIRSSQVVVSLLNVLNCFRPFEYDMKIVCALAL